MARAQCYFRRRGDRVVGSTTPAAPYSWAPSVPASAPAELAALQAHASPDGASIAGVGASDGAD